MTVTDPRSDTVDADGHDRDDRSAEAVLVRLRRRDRPRHLFGGFGPLVLAAFLLIVTMLLAPSVAPERVVERPVGADAGEAGP